MYCNFLLFNQIYKIRENYPLFHIKYTNNTPFIHLICIKWQYNLYEGVKMKRVFLLITIFATMAFGYNYNGTWKNISANGYNDPVVLKINGSSVSPVINRGQKRVALKAKYATNVGSGLFEAWGHGYRNLVLFIKPINSNKLKVIAKKIDTQRKRVVTKSFIFRKNIPPVNRKKRFVGNYRSSSNFSAIKKVTIREVGGKLFVRAWKNSPRGLQPLGVARAKYYNNRLHMTWNRGNLVVEATIKGYNYNSRIDRYRNLELSIRATNLNNGLTNSQTMQLSRGGVTVPRKPIYKRIKVGPVDVNLMINSY